MGCGRVLLAILFPPLAVMDKGCGSFAIVFLLSLAGWIPGVIAALIICQNNDAPQIVNVYGTAAQPVMAANEVDSTQPTHRAMGARRPNTGLRIGFSLVLVIAVMLGAFAAFLGDSMGQVIAALKNGDAKEATSIVGRRFEEVFRGSQPNRTPPGKDVAYWGNVPAQREFKASNAAIRQLLFTSDGATLVACDAENKIRVFETKTGRQIAQMPFPVSGDITAGALFPNSTRIAFVVYISGKSGVSLWDWSSGDTSALAAFDERTSQYATLGYVLGIAISADGKTLVAPDGGTHLHVWHWSDTSQYRPIERRFAISAAFLQPSNDIAAAGLGDAITIHERQTGKLKHQFKGTWANNEMATPIVAAPQDEKFFIGAGTRDHTHAGRIQLWRADKLLENSTASSGYINNLSSSGDGKYLLVSLGNGGVEIRDAQTLATLQVLTESKASGQRIFHPATLSPEGKLAAVGFEDGTIRLWSKQE
jgi:WD40 repeat protein/uncharacterized membrane protein YqaE (UPF0057 family)